MTDDDCELDELAMVVGADGGVLVLGSVASGTDVCGTTTVDVNAMVEVIVVVDVLCEAADIVVERVLVALRV